MTRTLDPYREGEHEACGGEQVQSWPGRVQTWDRCDCPWHAKEKAGIEMEEAFAR